MKKTVPDTISVAEDIIAGLAIGIIYLDGSGRIALMNTRAEAMLHTSASHVTGKRIDMLPLRTPVYRVLSENSREAPVEISVNGAVLRVRSRERRQASGEQSGEIYELFDVTEEKKEKRQREEIVAMTTHDLKSPLTVLMGYIQTLRSEGEAKVHVSLLPCLDEMERSALKLLDMIDDVLDAYRLEVGLLQTTRSWCDLAAILEGCCLDMAREASLRGVRLTYHLNRDIPALNVDGKQLSRVFANLIGNGVKFTRRRGEVMVDAWQRDGRLHVTVKDTGIGIPEQDLPRIFNKYFRSGNANGFKGTGLGLTISKAIVEAHGGSITVESTLGEGSTFTIVLPCTN
ncbi:ATP-binding protein [Geotalea sp. SG265]|uniref:sensor histidine kinase n=1 Tax=Geotalea sp. SG265 TaxID=2922867 RepID=UPI001FB01978|nr:ATP-binding protein [Geotalea sp. SG265]